MQHSPCLHWTLRVCVFKISASAVFCLDMLQLLSIGLSFVCVLCVTVNVDLFLKNLLNFLYLLVVYAYSYTCL